MRDERARTFFSHLVAEFGAPAHALGLRTICVAHEVDSARYYVPALDRLAPLRLLIPKPASVMAEVHDELKGRNFGIQRVSRKELIANPHLLDGWIQSEPDVPVALVDIGGYFAPVLGAFKEIHGSRIAGVVEDTENGIREYEERYGGGELPYPIVSVARSPLKDPEDHLVGLAVVFSVEACLRRHAGILQGRAACVVGYGKVGRGAAHALRDRRVATTVFETDPVRAIEAQSHGFYVPDTLDQALRQASIVISATGQQALSAAALKSLPDGAYVASVTSVESEFPDDAVRLFRSGIAIDGSNAVIECETDQGNLYVLNGGNAVNFLDGGALGPFIYLVQAEMLASVASLAVGGLQPGFHELGVDVRRRLAELWREHFNH